MCWRGQVLSRLWGKPFSQAIVSCSSNSVLVQLHMVVGLLTVALLICLRGSQARTLGKAVAVRTSAAPDGYVAMCLITRDSNDLRDWIHHYLNLGVSKVYLFDHNSSIPVIKQVWDYVVEDTVVYHYIEDFDIFQGHNIVQFEAYRQCIKKYAAKHQFLAFLDDDEYLVLKPNAGTQSIPKFLQAFEGYGGLAINWQIISSSGHVARPKGRVTDNYIACLPEQHYENTHVKVIANTKFVVSTDGNPHTFRYMSDAETVNENFEIVPSAWSDPVSTKKVVLYHYTVKSQQDFHRKTAWPTGAGGGTTRSQAWFGKIQTDANETCTLLLDRRQALISVNTSSAWDKSNLV